MLTMNRLALLGSACLIASVLSHCGGGSSTPADMATPDMTMGDMAMAKPAPTISAVSPATATTAGGGMLTITGTDFQTGATVTVGGTACSNPTVTPTSITCTIPAKAGSCGAAAVVVTNPDMQSVSNGNGFAYRTAMLKFATPVTVTSGNAPRRVAIGDLNNDGKLDVVTANQGGNNISVFINNGTGGLMAATNIAAGTAPTDIAIGDINGDGKPDIVACNMTTANVSVFLQGATAGAFGAAMNYATGTAVNPIAIAVGDLNGDKYADVVVKSNTIAQVAVLLANNTGTGALGTATIVTVAGTGGDVALVDVTNDAKVDLITTNFSMNNFTMMPGNANGTFGTAVNTAVGTGPVGLAVADLDKDGKLDVVTANQTTNNVSFVKGNNGTFSAAANTGTANAPETVAVADLNNDGIPDIITSNGNTNNFSFLAGTGNGTFAATVNTASGANGSFGFATADLSGDGLGDVVVGNSAANNVGVHLQQCQ